MSEATVTGAAEGPVAVTGPAMSARDRLSRRQRICFAGFGLLVAGCLALATTATLTALSGIAGIVYLLVFAERVVLLRKALAGGGVWTVSEADLAALPDADLPVYTVLIPAYGEPQVLPHLLTAVAALDYPADRLDVILLLEEEDEITYHAAVAARPPGYVKIVRVPYSEPQTKPKACNVGLAMARGELLTIYDAEDRPEPLQLRRAAVAFHQVPDRVACLQARLAFFNHEQNIITNWFTTEYAMWFRLMLPGLVQQDAPIPLGGTSNHFRVGVLRELAGWDPWNVTEDADLGVRLHRAGMRTLVLDSVTWEEANSDFINWVKQRSRWFKGYLQTWLVHTRHPIRMCREVGVLGFLRFNLFVGGTPLLALLNPVFWALSAAWASSHLGIVQALFPAPLFYPGLICSVLGNFTFVYVNLIAARQTGIGKLVPAALLSPLYWAMMSLAAAKALVQLIVAPSFWEKTTHGLGEDPEPEDVITLPEPQGAPTVASSGGELVR